MATRETALRREMRGGKPRYDDDADKDDRGRFTSGAPVALSSSSRPKAVTGSVTPRQTMDAIILPKGKGGGGSRRENTSFGSTAAPTKARQTQPKGRAARQKERRELKGGKKGGKR